MKMQGVAAPNKAEVFHLDILKPPSNYIVINTSNEIRVCLKKGSRPYDSAPLYGLRLNCTYENSGEAYTAVEYDGAEPTFDAFGIGIIKFRFLEIAQVIDRKIKKIKSIISVYDEANQVVASTATFPVVCVEYYLDVQVSLPPPHIFYKDKGGKDAGMNMTVYLKRGNDIVPDMPIKIRPALQYENGKMVEDQGILKSINDLDNFNITTGMTKLKFRINEVSSKHMNNKFCIVMMKNVPGDEVSDVAPGRSLAIDVRSKTNRKRDEENDEDGMGCGSGKRQKDDSSSLPLTNDSLALISGKMSKDLEDSIARLHRFYSEMSKMLDAIRWRQNVPAPFPNDNIDNFLREWNLRFEDSMKTLVWVHNTLTKNEQTRISVGRLFELSAPYTQESFFSNYDNVHRALAMPHSLLPIYSQESAAPLVLKSSLGPFNWNTGGIISGGQQQGNMLTQPQPPPSSSGMAMLAEAAKVAEHNETPQGLASRTQPISETPLAAVLRNIKSDADIISKKWNDADVRYILKARVTIDNIDHGFPAFAQNNTTGTYRLCGFYQIKVDQVPSNIDRNQVLFSAVSKKKVTVNYSAALGSSEFLPQPEIFAVEHPSVQGHISYVYMQPDHAIISPFLRHFVFAKLDQLPSLQLIHSKLEVVLSPSVQLLSDLIRTNEDSSWRVEISEALQRSGGLGRAYYSFDAAGDVVMSITSNGV